jgi:trk system potassium uptake protein TrkA
MRIIIVGGGIVGYSLAEYLLKEGHRLCLVETDPHLCETIAERLDLQVINGSGSSPAVMKAAGVSGADMVLAVTPVNEVNIVACSIALQHDVKQRIARLRGEEYAGTSGLIDLDKIGITSVIHPEKVLVDQVLQFVQTPHSVQSANFEGGKILMRGYQVTENMPLAKKTPREVRQQIAPDTVLFSALVRRGDGMIPDGDTVIEPGDTLYTLFPVESLERFLSLVGFETKPSRKIIVTGDSYSTLVMVEALEELDAFQVTFVDPDIKHAEQAAAMFSRTEVLHGDCTEDELLRELHVDRASFFIAISDSPDYNMLSALLAKAEGAHEVIATTTDMRHNKLYKSIGIDHVINPRLTTAREILEIISRGHIGAVVRLSDVDIQAVRFNVDPDSDMAGAKVRKIATKLKKGSIIGVIVRQDRMILPDGESVIEAGDHVIVITHRRNLPTLSKLFKPRRLFRRG